MAAAGADAGFKAKDDSERLTLTVPEAARLLGIGRGLAYELARTGDLPVLRLGKRLLVPRAQLEHMLLGATEHEPTTGADAP